MARQNYQHGKRQRELAKKQKREEKAQKRAEKKNNPDGTPMEGGDGEAGEGTESTGVAPEPGAEPAAAAAGAPVLNTAQ